MKVPISVNDASVLLAQDTELQGAIFARAEKRLQAGETARSPMPTESKSATPGRKGPQCVVMGVDGQRCVWIAGHEIPCRALESTWRRGRQSCRPTRKFHEIGSRGRRLAPEAVEFGAFLKLVLLDHVPVDKHHNAKVDRRALVGSTLLRLKHLADVGNAHHSHGRSEQPGNGQPGRLPHESIEQ
jgi:hypothetical protein